MSCHGCGEQKKSRYLPNASADIDQGRSNNILGADHAPGQDDRARVMSEMQRLPYERLVEERDKAKNWWATQTENELAQMSPAMRRLHVEELLALVNCDNVSPVGMSPEQALVALRSALARPEFTFISDLYPALRGRVELRYEELQKRRIEAT